MENPRKKPTPKYCDIAPAGWDDMTKQLIKPCGKMYPPGSLPDIIEDCGGAEVYDNCKLEYLNHIVENIKRKYGYRSDQNYG